MSVYAIICNETNEVYIGSSMNIKNRMWLHRSITNKTMSKQIIDRNNYHVHILEDGFEEVDYHMKEVERWYIENYSCINKNIPGRTKQEYLADNRELILAYNKEYDKINRDKIKARVKKYNDNNKEKRKAQNKAYRDANIDKNKARNKAYRVANIDKIKAREKAYRLKKKQDELNKNLMTVKDD